MKNKRFTAKILIDIGMTICLLLLMPYSLLSETAHEWIGMAMLVLFISHHILNHKWVTSVRKGKYNAFRVIQTVLVIIMLILIMGSMISGILLSNHIFKWIKISGTYMTARQIHMFCAYWGLVVMSLHLGFHWNIAVAMAGRLWEHPSVIRTWAARSVATTIAGYLNLQGIKKIPRQNGTLETWSSHFIRLILDNPVYCGKIAYGRRTREKVKGTKNEYKQVHAEDYILEDGQHEGIISEELWQKVHAKRMATGIKQPSKIGKDRSHLLTGILKCPLCGSSMYTNKHAWTNKDGTYKEVYYYICGRNKQERGHHCDYKASLRKTDIEPLVIEAVKELVSDKYFAKEIEKRIGVQTDTTAIDKELANYESKLKEVDLNKARLEREIDNLPIDARFRERKIHDMTLRLDALYDTIVELEERIEDAKLRKSSIEMETITLDNIYKLMLNFGKLYDIISDEEKKSLITYLIKEIQIYPNGESEQPLKSIEFNFPIYRDGQEVRRLLWEKGNTVETVVLLSQQKPDDTIEIDLDLDELDATSAETKATYQEIKDYVLKEFGLKVSNLYISQIKRKCGIEVGENYNLPKTENPKVPQCPKEKEDAIKAALKYFAMI